MLQILKKVIFEHNLFFMFFCQYYKFFKHQYVGYKHYRALLCADQAKRLLNVNFLPNAWHMAGSLMLNQALESCLKRIKNSNSRSGS